MDRALVGPDSGARPPRLDFDTRNLANGRHALTVRAWDAAGNAAEASVAFDVFNPSAGSLPAVPPARHYAHIRVAALAYTGNPIGPAEEEHSPESVDLVVPNARYLGEIEQGRPGARRSSSTRTSPTCTSTS